MTVDDPRSCQTSALCVRDWGVMDYARALGQQREVNAAVAGGRQPDTLVLVEHAPVITITPRRGAGSHLLASPDRLAALGIAVAETDRGGDITYHGPGQLVAYPILRLAPHGLNLSRYMRLLEQVVIDTVASLGVRAHREAGATGVWATSDQQPAAKLCAMGVRIRKNTTMHGLALNVSPDLSHFQTIVPCGLGGRAVTSLRELRGDDTPTMEGVKAELVKRFDAALAPTVHGNAQAPM